MQSQLGVFIEVWKKKDHWEALNELAFAMAESSTKILEIRNNMEKTAESRQQLAIEVARAHMFLEVCKTKLSIMDGEFTEVMKKQIDKEITEESVDFSDTEF